MNIQKISDIDITNIKNKKTVFVSGVSGQTGSYMVEYLLKNTDYKIFGGVRRLSVANYDNLKDIDWSSDRVSLVNFDLTDTHSIAGIIEKLKPDYFINLAAQSFVGSSWDFPAQTWECNTLGIIHILEAIRKYNPTCRFYQAGSSEEYGNVAYTPQDENHPLRPRSPYGASKAASRHIVKVYRESYNLYAVQGLLYNQESKRRGKEFVTRKVTCGIAKIKKSLVYNETFSPIELGNIYAQRDWSHAEDFVDGIWKMLNQEGEIKDYLLSSNETHSIKEFVELAFKIADIKGTWHGNGINEEFSINTEDAEKYQSKSSVLVKINTKFYRPAEVDILLGDSTKARTELKWQPKKNFNQLVEEMVLSDLEKEKI